MNKQNLIIYDFIELFSILEEIKDNLNFNLLNVSNKEFSDLKLNQLILFLVPKVMEKQNGRLVLQT